MITKPLGSERRKRKPKVEAKKTLHRLLENDLHRRVTFEEYRDKVRDKYDGPQGALLAAASLLSLHTPLGDRLFRERRFDLHGARQILDVGSGAGQLLTPLLKYADREARVIGFDLSLEMLRRARQRLRGRFGKNLGAQLAAADVTRLPFRNATFDCVTCGYVLEHLPDPRPGLAELARVLVPGGRLLLLATEDSFFGAWNSHLWCCRTFNRRELEQTCGNLGLVWRRELWFSRMHRMFRAGGICVEVQRQGESCGTRSKRAKHSDPENRQLSDR